MFDIPIYSAEKNIAELIKKSNSINHIVPAIEIEPFNVPGTVLQKLEAAQGEERQNIDLYYLKALLVTSCLNGNDDFFLPQELWAAKHTVADKPFNLEHECDDIIGHTVGSYVVDNEGKIVDNNKTIDEIPSQIHIIANSVIYKKWSKQDKQDRINRILPEIKNGEWFVSVECLFPNFDYALFSGDNLRLIARNEKTAFLTQYLRIYGGIGVYDGQKIGRVPRNLIVSGKGLVKEPANKLSQIFANKKEFSKNNTTMVYELIEVKKMDNTKLEQDYKKLQDEFNQLKASIDAGKTKELTNKIDTLSTDLTKAQESIVAKDQEITSLKDSVTQLSASKESLTKQIDELNKSKQEISEKLTKIEAEKSLQARIALCKDKLKLNDEQAKNYVANLDKLPEEAFAKHIEFQAQFVTVASQNTVVETKVEADTKALETVKQPEAKVETPALNVTTASANENAKKLAEEINKWRVDAGYVQTQTKNKFNKNSK